MADRDRTPASEVVGCFWEVESKNRSQTEKIESKNRNNNTRKLRNLLRLLLQAIHNQSFEQIKQQKIEYLQNPEQRISESNWKKT